MTLQTQMVLYLRLINLEAAKQIYQAIIAVFNVLRHGIVRPDKRRWAVLS